MLPVDVHPLFTITRSRLRRLGRAAYGDIAENAQPDIAIAAPGQNTDEHAATIRMQDMSGPLTIT